MTHDPRSFDTRALAWLRERHRVEPGAAARREGSVAMVMATLRGETSTAAFDIAGVAMLVVSAAMAVLTEQSTVVDELGRRMLHTGSIGALVLGLGLLALGWLVRSNADVPLAVRVHAGRPEPIVAHAIEDLRAQAPNREAWVVAEHGFSSDALMAATRLGVRCFHARGPDIEEVVRDDARRERPSDAIGGSQYL